MEGTLAWIGKYGRTFFCEKTWKQKKSHLPVLISTFHRRLAWSRIEVRIYTYYNAEGVLCVRWSLHYRIHYTARCVSDPPRLLWSSFKRLPPGPLSGLSSWSCCFVGHCTTIPTSPSPPFPRWLKNACSGRIALFQRTKPTPTCNAASFIVGCALARSYTGVPHLS